MYNRYIPQPDGTYRRKRMPEPITESKHTLSEQNSGVENSNPSSVNVSQEMPVDECQITPTCAYEEKKHILHHPIKQHTRNRQDKPHNRHSNISQDKSIAGFLQNILPSDFDTSDLLIIILLILMAGDCQEEQNSALLTLALYLIL